jgi:IS5 family transposase
MIVFVMAAYIEPKQPGLFDAQDRLAELHAMGDPLHKLDSVIDWEVFRPVLARIPKDDPAGPGGRPAFDPLMMFKVLVIAHMYNLGDSQLEFQITDRHSFKRFLGVTDADKAPDEKTIWAFRNVLAKNDLMKQAFDAFHAVLEDAGLFARKGQIVDASFVEVPRQRNSREDNAAIKQGEVPEGWEDRPEMLRQKDLDARWTKKNQQKHYGYKNHVKVDSKSKLIDAFAVTDAAVHDSQALEELLAEGDPTTWVDSGYAGASCEAVFESKGVKAKVIERAYRNRPLTARQRRRNRAKSRVRVRVEHVFGAMHMCMRAAWNRCIGITRNKGAIAMTNLIYNMIRFEQINRLQLRTW